MVYTPKVIQGSGTGRLSNQGKLKVAESMYHKGRAFVGAAMLLRQQGGYEYVVLHLLCQGIEIILKSLLLYSDYDLYKTRNKRLGHNLEHISNEVINILGMKPLRRDIAEELHILNDLYKAHRLRYGNGYDLLGNPNTISSYKVLKKICCVMKLMDRHISWK